MIRIAIGTPRSARMSDSSTSSQSTGLPTNFSTSVRRNFIAKAAAPLFLRSRRCPQGTREIVFHAIEDAVDESSRIAAAECLRQLDCFVDGNDRRDVVAIKHFV